MATRKFIFDAPPEHTLIDGDKTYYGGDSIPVALAERMAHDERVVQTNGPAPEAEADTAPEAAPEASEASEADEDEDKEADE